MHPIAAMTLRRLAAMVLLSALATGPATAGKCGREWPSYQPELINRPVAARYLTTQGKLRIVGYNDMSEMLLALSDLFARYHPGFSFELVLKGTRTAPAALTDGSSLFAPMGAEMEEAPLVAFMSAHGSEPVMIRVAHDSLDPRALSSPTGLFVHRSNPLTRISIAEAQRIFTVGEASIARWAQLGARGPLATQPIRPVGLGADTAIGSFMRRHKFGGARFVDNYRAFARSTDVIAAVEKDPTAIGFANLNHATSNVRALHLSWKPGKRAYAGTPANLRAGRYPLGRHLLVYARREADGRIDPIAGAWLRLILSCEGQSVIGKGSLGYIPLGKAEVEHERRKLEGL